MGKARVVWLGGQQFVLLPDAFRFNDAEVVVRRDKVTGDVILSNKKPSWEGFEEQTGQTNVPADFMSDRQQGIQDRDPFDGWDGRFETEPLNKDVD